MPGNGCASPAHLTFLSALSAHTVPRLLVVSHAFPVETRRRHLATAREENCAHNFYVRRLQAMSSSSTAVSCFIGVCSRPLQSSPALAADLASTTGRIDLAGSTSLGSSAAQQLSSSAAQQLSNRVAVTSPATTTMAQQKDNSCTLLKLREAAGCGERHKDTNNEGRMRNYDAKCDALQILASHFAS